MAKVPSIPAREVLKTLTKFGWEVKRQSGSHVILVKEGLPITLSVPNHNPVARGTLRVLISAAGLTVEEFIERL